MVFILALFGLFARLLCGQTQAGQADLVVTAARIYTMDPARPRASSLAVKDGRILAVGDDVTPWLGPATRRIDAHGATLVPGFIDAHGHMQGLGDSLEILDLRGQSQSGIAASVKQAAAKSAPGEWIRGRAWDQTLWPGREFPNHAVLDDAAPRNPVYLTRVDGHAAWVNARALESADIQSATPDPDGGKILRDTAGKPTGVLIDRAQRLVSQKIPPATPAQVRARLARAARECVRWGITSVHDAGVSAADLDAYRSAIAAGEMPVHIYAMIGGEGSLWRDYLARGPEIGDRLTVRSIKLVADGALGSRGAAMKAPYADDPGNRGLLILKREDIERVARQAVARGFQVNTHAIGDLANRTVLDAYAAALGGPNDRRFRIEHAQVVSLEDIPLFARYSIIASIQTTHATSDMRWAEARVGAGRVKGAYAWRRFLKAGVRITNGSDFPVEHPNPIAGLYSAVTRQGWYPDQCLTREEALRSFTLDGAYAAFEESIKGSLAPGKLADFVLLTRDIMTAAAEEIPAAHVTLTVSGGKVVYSE